MEMEGVIAHEHGGLGTAAEEGLEADEAEWAAVGVGKPRRTKRLLKNRAGGESFHLNRDADSGISLPG